MRVYLNTVYAQQVLIYLSNVDKCTILFNYYWSAQAMLSRSTCDFEQSVKGKKL